MKTMEATGVGKSGRARSALVAAIGIVLGSTLFGAVRLRAAESWGACAQSAPPASAAFGKKEPVQNFACGDTTCDAKLTYCETINTDVPALPSNYACRPLPRECLPRADGAPRDCRCFPPQTRGDYCSGPIQGGFQRFYRTSVGGH